ncbi:hypothetical protein PybrP1_008031 [[Pythium] brassicae (nom. inval.)]|nr:hypothetical protein PybrP1_008031 [[Pythium] brassicae (nom. inval.)]
MLALRLAKIVAPPVRQAPAMRALATAATSASSRRARRLRRAKTSPESVGMLSEARAAVRVVSAVPETSRCGVQQRVEMPEELLRRLASLVKRRTHAQLEALRAKYVVDETNERQMPLDAHKHPVGWALDRDPQIPVYAYGPTETMAYLAFEIDGVYACAHHALRQLQQQHPNFAPESVLDFGAGPGTASWVAKEFYDASATRYRVVEPSQSMVDAAEVVLEGFPGLSVRRGLVEMRREIETGVKYDLIMANYVLSEITSDYERVAVMSALWELLSDKGCLVLVDRGSSWGSHQVRSARQFILDSVAEEEGESVKIIAPCVHHFECPAAGSTWCHFVQRSPQVQRPREATPKRWNGQKGSKFSYVIMEKNGAEDADPKRRYARMIRNPLLATRHVHLDLCTPEGELERRSVTKGKHLREVYRASRKAQWGALWPADASIYTDKKQ